MKTKNFRFVWIIYCWAWDLPLSVVYLPRETSLEKNCFPFVSSHKFLILPPVFQVLRLQIYIIVMAHHETNYLKPKFYLLLRMMSVNVSMCTVVHMPRSEDKLVESVFSFHLFCGFWAPNSGHEVYAASTFMHCTIALSQFLAYQRKTSTERKERREWAGGMERKRVSEHRARNVWKETGN